MQIALQNRNQRLLDSLIGYQIILDLSGICRIPHSIAVFLSILFDKHTVAAMAWRALVAICDWRTMCRRIAGNATIDVVFLTNMRDNIDRKNFLGKYRPACGHFNGPRYWFKGICGRTRSLDITARELINPHTRREAKDKFIDAVRWAQSSGAKVVLLAAGTKRLFGRDGKELKELFPDLVFTIGDNGTALLLKLETLRALKEAGLTPANSRIAILGPYGLLGEQMVIALKKSGYQIIGAGPNGSLKSLAEKCGIDICRTFADMGKVDAVVACTHSEEICLNGDVVEAIRRPNKKLLVIDVAEPSNFTQAEYDECRDISVRQDAGNAYARKLKYVFGALAYRRFRLTRGVAFGCFAEALSLFASLRRHEEIRSVDWFIVDDVNMKVVEELFKKDEITIPSPRCFGKVVKSFNLDIIS